MQSSMKVFERIIFWIEQEEEGRWQPLSLCHVPRIPGQPPHFHPWRSRAGPDKWSDCKYPRYSAQDMKYKILIK